LSKRTLMVAAATVVAGALALSACTPQPQSGQTAQVNTNTTATVMWNQPVFGYNEDSTFGNATANANIVYMTSDEITYYDGDLELVTNKSFGSYEKVSDDPLTVKLSFADTAQWSDGTPVTAADIVLSWGALSGQFATVTDQAQIDGLTNEDGSLKPTEGDQVYFDGASPSYGLITEFPQISEDLKEITYTYSKPYADWEHDLIVVGLPAHIVAKRALGTADAAAGQQAIIDAFKNRDNAALAKIANSWNSDWNFGDMPSDADLLVTSGPYVISDLRKDEYIQLSKNANYKGERQVSIDTLTVRFNEDPMAAVQALQNGEVQAIQPQATADVLTALQALEGVTVSTGDGATYEHVDLTFNNGGAFDPAAYGGDAEKARLVRQAFLHTIPRGDIVERIIKPLNPNAVVRQAWEVIPGSPNYDDAVAANGLKDMYGDGGNVEKAQELLAQAGVPNPQVRVLYAQTNQRRIQQFTLIKESAEKAGFTVIDNGSPNWGQKLGDKTYDAALFGWQSTSLAVGEGDANYRSAPTPGANNYGGYANPEVDKLWDEMQVTTDPARQKTILQEVEKHLVADGFGIPIFQFPEITAYRSSLQGIDSIPLAPTLFWNFWEWKVA